LTWALAAHRAEIDVIAPTGGASFRQYDYGAGEERA
jgi:hypothetical protein